MKLDYCFHTHTSRCGHASGLDEEYVVSAIKAGIRYLGFSDHVFLPHVIQPHMRGDISCLEDYLNSVSFLKEKYKDQIDLCVGFECEYSSKFTRYYKKLLDKNLVDYLILGQHCSFDDKYIPHWYFYHDCPDTCAIEYTNNLLRGMRSGLFKYVCHPDLFLSPYKSWTPMLEKCAKRIFLEAEKRKIPLEINMGGFRKKRWQKEEYLGYPNKRFWEMSKKYDIEIVVGVDAHEPNEFNKEDIDEILTWCDSIGLKVNLNFRI